MKKIAIILSTLLMFFYTMTFFAERGWMFDIFSHFAIQYAIGGVVLSLVFIFYKKWMLALPLLFLVVANIYEIRQSYSDPYIFSSPHQEKENLTIIHYNKLFKNQRWDLIRTWFEDNHDDIDLVFVQESGPRTIEKLKILEDIFPYQFPETPKQRFNDVSILSKTPFDALRVVYLDINRKTVGTKVIFNIENANKPVHIYSHHAYTPLNAENYQSRSDGLETIQRAIQGDNHPYKIFTGDWNLTPYSPVFQKLLAETDMKYNDYSYFPKVTWNSYFVMPFLKIPIDHFIYSPSIKQISKEVGPSLGSDHHMVIAKFYIPES